MAYEAWHCAFMSNQASLPAYLFLSTDCQGRDQVCCENCSAKALSTRLAAGATLLHSRSCRTRAQVGVSAPVVAQEAAAPISAHQEVAALRKSLPRGANVCDGQPEEKVRSWVKAGAVTVSDAMNTDF